jgi:hypothetical protein
MVSGVSGLFSAVVLGDVGCKAWWLVTDEDAGPGRIVAGPFEDRPAASWAAGAYADARPVYGISRADGGLHRRQTPEDCAWLAHLDEELDRLPDGWDAGLADEDPLVTLVVEVAAALSEAGLSLRDSSEDGEVGGVCLMPEPGMGGVVVTWGQPDRMSVEQIHGPETTDMVQQVMNRALAEVLQLRGFVVDPFAGGSGHVVRPAD